MLPDPHLRAPIAIALGAIPGALARYYVSLACSQWWGNGWPWGTLLVNVLGSFLLGFFVTWVLERSLPVSPEIQLLITVGFLGSFTTFSTYTLDVITLGRSHTVVLAFGYWLGSAVLGVISLYAGILAVQLLR